MKKTLLSIALIFSIAKTFSQVPNAGFENWLAYPPPPATMDYEEPVSWTSQNSYFPSYPITVSKSVDTCSGNYSMLIENKHYLNAIGNDDTLQGIAITGTDFFSGGIGIQFLYRATSMSVCAKYIKGGSDSAELNIKFTKWNSTSQMTQDVSTNFCFAKLGSSTAGHITVTVPISFISAFPAPNTPDTAIISFSPNLLNASHRSVNSKLWIDNVVVNTDVGEIELFNGNHSMHVYPNPATDEISFSSIPAKASRIRVMDIIGNEVGNYPVQNSVMKVSLKNLSKGIYIYEALSAENKILSSGKFSIAE